jgi:uncharacterized protein YicC (UPF0701 family)
MLDIDAVNEAQDQLGAAAADLALKLIDKYRMDEGDAVRTVIAGALRFLVSTSINMAGGNPQATQKNLEILINIINAEAEYMLTATHATPTSMTLQ